ncbi:hypothetical protein EI94DRAFT_701025 [Lactarius quietus]|nr:hypothetical protein EI94DRAFT_701025 [Lactarius quietus]
MGFFSSRRHDSDVFLDTSSQQLGHSPSPGVIRSRFYGRNKGKSRETNATLPQGAIPSPAHSRGEPSFNDSPPTFNGHRSTKGSDMRSMSESPMLSSPSHATSRSPGPPNPRASTNAITTMLAQRLAELASANAEGLLDDDEYRLLRQNLFERLGNSTVPQENPVVPIAGPSRPRAPGTPQRKNSTRAPSVQSKGTSSSSVSGFLRRATGRRNASTDADTLHSDSTSFLSTSSNSPTTFARRLLRLSSSKQSSAVSLKTDPLPSAFDSLSPTYTSSPMRSGGPLNSSPSISRSSTTRSKRRAPPPPSAFPHRANGSEPKRMQTHSIILDDDVDDGELKSSKEIRAQIEAVEAEGRRLMDAFNGLELSALTRKSQSPPLPTSGHFLQGFDSFDSSWSFRPPKDADGMSLRSATSNGTNLSAHRSPVRTPRSTPNPPLVSQPILLGHKSSISSLSSRGRSATTNGAPHLPALPSSLGRLWAGSSSSVNLTRSTGHLPLAPVAEGDTRESVDGHVRHLRIDTSSSALVGTPPASSRRHEVIGDEGDIMALESEMAEIRRRRAEVMGRYDERLGYLRAKLKGAELHERLLRR